MKILVTGANGFIGSNIVKKFKDNGHKVIGWDLNSSSINDIAVKKVDLLSVDEIKNNLNIDCPEIIIHCAGSADVSKSVTNPDLDFLGNVQVTHNLLFSIHNCEIKPIRTIFLSSAAVYGNPNLLPISEEATTNPLSPYALHKLMSEDICKYFISNYDMDIKIARIFSAYGIGLKKQIFWDMHQKSKKYGELGMFGTGNESRDFINVEDVIQTIYLIAFKAPKEEIFYNVGNGEEITIRHIAENFGDYYGIEQSKINFNGNSREGDPKNWKADVSKIKSLGYMKSVDIEDGIKSYTEWVKSL